MKRLLCWWATFYGSWLDPWTWRLRLDGADVRWDGHLWARTVGLSIVVCTRCGAREYRGWRQW